MKPKAPWKIVLTYAVVALALYYVWQIPMIKKAIGGNVPA